MSFILDNVKPISTIEEIKKLQELVRKLELQNLRLRNKQVSNKCISNSPVKEYPHTLGSGSSSFDNKTVELKTCSATDICLKNISYLKPDEYFDDLEIIRVSDIELSDDESWLYSSPTNISVGKKESPHIWLRKDANDLDNKQLQIAKKALLSKLNELQIRKIRGSSPIDTRTFTRSQKKEALHFLDKFNLFDNEKNLDIYSVEPSCWKKDTNSEFLGTCHVLEDANDVQEVARMQEESLRMNSPMGTSNRCSMKQSLKHSDVSNAEPLEYSNLSSSPSESHYDSNLSLHEHSKETVNFSGYHRSLPNLSSDSSLLIQTGDKIKRAEKTMIRKHPTNLKVLYPENELGTIKKVPSLSLTPRQPKCAPHLRNQAFQVSQASAPITNVSHNIDSSDVIVTTKSCLPRPSKSYFPSQSIVRSGIPASSSLSKKRQDDTWSEGCF